jgi:thioredoxin reductase
MSQIDHRRSVAAHVAPSSYREVGMNRRCDVAIIGAGPHGLSIAAHLRAQGIDFRIFGRPLGTWSEHMPKDMVLKSDGFASNLSAPSPDSTLKAYCTQHGIPYASQGLPISLDTFLTYANFFRKRYVPDVEDTQVSALERDGETFVLTLETGERVAARQVVAAVGISWFAYTPPAFAHLPAELLSHSYDHRDGDGFSGRDVAVVGAGASAVDLAWSFHQNGASVQIVARAAEIEFNSVPDPDAETFFKRIHRPASGIGRGWRSYFCANAPLMFYRLPEGLRARAVQSHMHPAAGWFMREKIEGRVGTLLGRNIAKAKEANGRVALTLVNEYGCEEPLICDRVVAATGYRPDLRRIPFLTADLRACISSPSHRPIVSDNFETPVNGLYFVGPSVIDRFGPLMRFMVASEFVAPRLSAHLAKKFVSRSERQAA